MQGSFFLASELGQEHVEHLCLSSGTYHLDPKSDCTNYYFLPNLEDYCWNQERNWEDWLGLENSQWWQNTVDFFYGDVEYYQVELQAQTQVPEGLAGEHSVAAGYILESS